MPRSKSPQRASWRKRLLFAIASPAIFLLFVELVARVANVAPEPRFFVKDSVDPRKWMRAPDYREFFATPAPSFLRTKPANGFRVAIIGESTVAGYPFFHATFSDRLGLMLSDALPEYNCEVINCGFVGWTTFRLLDVLDECLQYKPDVVIWMVGHNEERSADNVLRLRARVTSPIRAGFLHFLTSNSRAARWLLFTRQSGIATFDPAVTRSMPRLGPEREKIQQSFREGLQAAILKIKKSGARPVLTTMPRNARTLGPSGSATRPDLPPAEAEKLNVIIQDATAAFEQKDYVRALALVDAAVHLDRSPADVHFLRGRVLEAIGRCDEARLAFIESMERDLWPSRARTWTEDAIRNEARTSAVPLVDLEAIFDAAGNCNVAGAEWLCDDVHPNLEGHRVIAEQLFQGLRTAGYPVSADRFQADRVRSEQQIRRSFGTAASEVFSTERALGYTKLFESLVLPPSEAALRTTAAREACERLSRAHALIPTDARVEILLGTAEIVAGLNESGVAHLRSAFDRDAGAAEEFAKIARAGPTLLQALENAGVALPEAAKPPR